MTVKTQAALLHFAHAFPSAIISLLLLSHFHFNAILTGAIGGLLGGSFSGWLQRLQRRRWERETAIRLSLLLVRVYDYPERLSHLRLALQSEEPAVRDIAAISMKETARIKEVARMMVEGVGGRDDNA